MNAVTFNQLPEARAFARPTKKYTRIFIDSAIAAHLDYPFADSRTYDSVDVVEVFDADGNRYPTLEAFATAFDLTVQFSEAPEVTQEVPLKEEVTLDITQTFTFRSIEELRRTWRQASAVAQRELKLIMTGIVKIGKERKEAGKQWIEAPISLSNLEVERVATKWIFFTALDDTTYFAKDFEGTYRFE